MRKGIVCAVEEVGAEAGRAVVAVAAGEMAMGKLTRTFLTCSVVFAAAVVSTSAGAEKAAKGYVPPDGFVPTAQTAIGVAEAVLIPVYGKDQIESERPFKATLNGNVWLVTGSV